jgi:hypothetical protein
MGGIHLNGRRSDGYSLRDALIKQGVTTEEALRKHLRFVHDTLSVSDQLDITRYRVNKNYPNGGPDMG